VTACGKVLPYSPGTPTTTKVPMYSGAGFSCDMNPTHLSNESGTRKVDTSALTITRHDLARRSQWNNHGNRLSPTGDMRLL